MVKKGSIKTRERLLVTASEVFAAKGYRDATVAEICDRAAANIAAVNYYFGSKEALYREAWLHALAQALKAHPPDGGVDEAAPAPERLRGWVRALLARIADENCKDFAISRMELANPTGLLSEVMRSELNPLREKTESLVRELLGPRASDTQVHFCEISIVSMCINPMVMKRVKQGDGSKGHGHAPIEDIEGFADHVVTFSLAGIAAVRGQA